MELQDNELLNNLSEKSDEARDVLYDKYKYIVDIIMNKYKRSAYYLSVDMQELRQEALLGFSDALYSFNDDKGCNLPTFISLCVERRVSNYLRKYNTVKMQTIHDMLSLDTMVAEDISLIDVIKDNGNSPEEKIVEDEDTKALIEKIKELLTEREMEIYKLLLNNFSYDDICKILNINSNQLSSTVYRMRQKLKDLY